MTFDEPDRKMRIFETPTIIVYCLASTTDRQPDHRITGDIHLNEIRHITH